MTQKKNPGRVDIDVTVEQLEQLGLIHAAAQLPQALGEAVKQELPAHLFLDRLLDAEHSRREERRIRTSLRLSGLPTGQTLGNFDFSFQPGIERSRIETLATCQWIRQHETVLIQGPPGVGKTHLSVSLGIKAVKEWPEILAGHEVMATALLDRLLHHCHVLNIKGRSYRLRDLERMLK